MMLLMYWKYLKNSEDCEAIGLVKICRPDWLYVIWSCSSKCKTSVRSDSNTRMEDDLTHKLYDIIKTNRNTQK